METSLVEYGILNEGSDIRAHVAYATRRIYVFQTRDAIETIKRGNYRLATAGQPGVNGDTSEGWLVPPEDIKGIRTLLWHEFPWWERFYEVSHNCSKKGKLAVEVVQSLMRQGRFPLWVRDAHEPQSYQMQLNGTDIILFGKWRVQVKCDWTAGPKSAGGSGHLYLQKSERNPLKRH